jgi:tetratricopeptide (TPR) repeat protein
MERPTRREILAAGAALAAGVLLPAEVRAGPLDADEVEVGAQALARDAEALGPALALRTARARLRVIDTSLAGTPRVRQRRVLHRAASTAAIVCVRASLWSGRCTAEWLALAETHASEAGDGPLLARVWQQRGEALGEAAGLAGCHSPAALQLYTAALHRAGSAGEQAGLRALTRFWLAWELAAADDRRGSLMELDAATFEAHRAGWSETAIGSSAGPPLRRLGRLADAERALARALDTAPVRRVCVLCDLARTHVAAGDADGAAEALEEAFLLTRAERIEGRRAHIASVRSVLPPGRATEQLDEVMRGS